VVYGVAGLCILTTCKTGDWTLCRNRVGESRYWTILAPLFVSYLLAFGFAIGLAGSREEALDAALINYLWPSGMIVVCMLAGLVRPSLSVITGCVLALAGVGIALIESSTLEAMLYRMRQHAFIYLLAFLAAIAWSVYSALIKLHPPATRLNIALLFLLTSIVLVAAHPLLSTDVPEYSVTVFSQSVLLGLLTAIGYSAWDHAMANGNQMVLALSANMTPLLASLLFALFTQVTLTSQLLSGILMVCAGSAIGVYFSRHAA
jgi:drug/metabolite transporter (DMT)-like permease